MAPKSSCHPGRVVVLVMVLVVATWLWKNLSKHKDSDLSQKAAKMMSIATPTSANPRHTGYASGLSPSYTDYNGYPVTYCP